MKSFELMSRKIQDEFMLLYSKKQVHEITVKELCENVGIARTAFYNYYSDIYDVLESVENALIFDLKEMNQYFYRSKILSDSGEIGFFKETLDYVKTHAFWFQTLLNKSRDGQFIYKWKRIIKEDFSKRYHYENKTPANENLVLELIASSVIGAYSYWVNNLNTVTPEEIEQEVISRVCIDFV